MPRKNQSGESIRTENTRRPPYGYGSSRLYNTPPRYRPNVQNVSNEGIRGVYNNQHSNGRHLQYEHPPYHTPGGQTWHERGDYQQQQTCYQATTMPHGKCVYTPHIEPPTFRHIMSMMGTTSACCHLGT